MAEPHEQFGDGGLARAGGADDAGGPAGGDDQGGVPEHGCPTGVGEGDLPQFDLPADPGGGQLAAVRVELDGQLAAVGVEGFDGQVVQVLDPVQGGDGVLVPVDDGAHPGHPQQDDPGNLGQRPERRRRQLPLQDGPPAQQEGADEDRAARQPQGLRLGRGTAAGGTVGIPVLPAQLGDAPALVLLRARRLDGGVGVEVVGHPAVQPRAVLTRGDVVGYRTLMEAEGEPGDERHGREGHPGELRSQQQVHRDEQGEAGGQLDHLVHAGADEVAQLADVLGQHGDDLAGALVLQLGRRDLLHVRVRPDPPVVLDALAEPTPGDVRAVAQDGGGEERHPDGAHEDGQLRRGAAHDQRALAGGDHDQGRGDQGVERQLGELGDGGEQRRQRELPFVPADDGRQHAPAPGGVARLLSAAVGPAPRPPDHDGRQRRGRSQADDGVGQ